MLDEKKRASLLRKYPFLEKLIALQEVTWLNPNKVPTATALADVSLTRIFHHDQHEISGLTSEDVADASRRLKRFAPYLAHVFPETRKSHGIIESDIVPIPNMREALSTHYRCDLPEKLWLKKG